MSQDKAALQACIDAFKQGKPVMVFDSAFREQETDLLYPALSTTPEVIRTLRKVCGGLLFLAVGHEISEKFGLPYLQDIHTDPGLVAKYPLLDQLKTNDLQYDSRSAFTLSLNHRNTFTGITDKDRALTCSQFAKLSTTILSPENNQDPHELLGKEFRTPGHVPLCKETEGGLAKRQGHTELAVAIARLSGLVPVTIGAEMLQPDGDLALPVEEAKKYAKENGIPFITGEELLNAFKQMSATE
eukprot:snap_masked-scaffold_32-processed-gene-2.3-mRNA-1 protein AED:0.14 eAED:0.14 QI:0/-1/0/1/-1/1/1/0/242